MNERVERILGKLTILGDNVDALVAEWDAALARAETAEYLVHMFRYELQYVIDLHKHDGPSSMVNRLQRALDIATPDTLHSPSS